MRKRNFAFVIDSIFWFLVSAMPIVLYGLSFLSRNYTPVALDNFFTFIGAEQDTTVVYGVLLDIFGTSGVLPLFDSPEIFTILSYFVNVQIIHLAVDFLLFIPRLAHDFLKRFGGDR